VGNGEVDAGLGGPDQERAGQQHGALAADERARGSRHRPEEVAQALERAPAAQHLERHQRDHDEGQGGAEHQQRPVAGEHGVAKDPVGHDHEDRRQGDRVERPLGDDRAEQLALAGLYARREQHHAQHLPGPRGEYVVAHIAHGRERVRVGAPGVDARQVEDAVPALGAQERRDGVDPDAAGNPCDRPAVTGQRGGVLLRCPPHDGSEGDQRAEDLYEREATIHDCLGAGTPARGGEACCRATGPG